MSTEPHRKAVGSIFDITITCNTYNAQYFSKEFGGLFSTKVQQKYSFNFLLQTLLSIYHGPVTLHWEQMVNCTGFVRKLLWEGNMHTANCHTR